MQGNHLTTRPSASVLKMENTSSWIPAGPPSWTPGAERFPLLSGGIKFACEYCSCFLYRRQFLLKLCIEKFLSDFKCSCKSLSVDVFLHQGSNEWGHFHGSGLMHGSHEEYGLRYPGNNRADSSTFAAGERRWPPNNTVQKSADVLSIL